MKVPNHKIVSVLLFYMPVLYLSDCKYNVHKPYYILPSTFTGVPNNFDYPTASSINPNVNNGYKGEYYYIVEVFDSSSILNKKANLLSKGVAKKRKALGSKINIPQALQNIYIHQTELNGLSVVQERTGTETKFVLARIKKAICKGSGTVS